MFLALAYQEKKMNQSESMESGRKSATLVDFLTSSLPRLDSPAWCPPCIFVTTQQLLPSLTICSFCFANSSSWISNYGGKKEISTPVIEVPQLLPITLPHGYSARSLLFPHSFWLLNPCLLQQTQSPPTHLRTHTLIYCPGQLCNALPTFTACSYLYYKSFLCISSLGLLSPTFLKINITFLGLGVPMCSFVFSWIHSISSHLFSLFSSNHLVNCQTQLPLC